MTLLRQSVCVYHLKRCKTSALVSFQTFHFAGGTGVTLVPVPTKTARSHNDIKGRRPFDVPAVFYPFVFFDRHGKGPSREPQPQRFYVYTVASIWYSLYMYLNIYFADMAEG